MAESGQTLVTFLGRYFGGDQGDCPAEDREDGGRIQAVYRTSRGETLWIIAEWDRTAITILLPEEYGAQVDIIN